MFGGLLIILLTALVAFQMITSLKKRFKFVDESQLRNLFFYHVLLSLVYYLYALFNPSDSKGYYARILTDDRGDNWFSYYGTSTTFIEFVGYPFVKYLNFSYEACMALFAFFGYVGFLYFYVFFKEHIRFRHTIYGFDFLTLIFFLPNLHFWSGSFGKGSIIFMGIGLFFYGLGKVGSRWITILIGGFIIYHVRPHIMLVILVSSAIGFVFTTKGIAMYLRVLFLLGVMVAFYYIYKDVLSMVAIDEEEFLSQGLDLTHRATELTKATSGVDITSYGLPMQVFTFLYRPLFIDAPGLLGLIVSFENLFYLLISFRLASLKGFRFLLTSDFAVKTAFFSFVMVSIPLAQISGNLGLAIRQKSQVMILFMFVIIAFMDNEKLMAYQQTMWRKLRKSRVAKLEKEKAL